ncbi:MAG TPA: FliG C-terminal domain-containing protein, partial [Planctomycetota bacterium]|nr:FliG C-terminal domain-containing protein [Planctomycetota bacterium]
MKKPFTGAQKAAALLLNLDAEAAANVLATLPDEAITAVGKAMVEIDPNDLDKARIDEIHAEFLESVREGASIPPGLSSLLERTVGKERGREILSRIEETVRRERPFVALERLGDAQCLRCLRDEHPQAIALVCSRIPPERAARLLAGLEEDERLDVITRLATMQPIPREVVDEVASSLAAKAQTLESLPVDDPNRRLRSVAEILNAADADVEKEILQSLEMRDAEMAKQIRERMFTFADLGRLDRRGMQKVLSTVDARVLALALKAADAEIVENFFSNMTKR